LCGLGCPSCPTTCPPSPAPSPYSAGFIPITNTGICAGPPGLVATDGCDDVCLLATCCNGWGTNNGNSMELQNRQHVNCSTVNCGNVCRMACDRAANANEACDKTCGEITSMGHAYVFSRPGCCYQGVTGPFAPTHVGFSFEVSRGVYLFGSVENGVGLPIVSSRFDNGFWMATGSLDQMFATLKEPCESCFHEGNRGGRGIQSSKATWSRTCLSATQLRLQKPSIIKDIS
jgi:hypothetical protein